MPKIIDYTLVEKLYDPTLSDRANAEKIGISKSSFVQWRKANGYTSKFRIIPVDLNKLKELHSKGFSDPKIAMEMGITRHGARKCRERLGLALNGYVRGPRVRRQSYDVKQSMAKAKCIEFETGDPESLFCDGEFLEQFKKGEFEERAQ